MKLLSQRVHWAGLALVLAAVHVTAAGAPAAGTITGKEIPIAVGPGDQGDPSISGPVISFTDISSGTADVYFYDERTKAVLPAASGPGDQEFSRVSGQLIAYTEFAGLAPAEVWTYDIATGVATNISNRPDSDQWKPAVSSQIVAWEDKRQGLPHIFVYVLSTGVTQQISGGGPQVAPAASGGRVAYTDNSTGDQVKIWDLATGVTTSLMAQTSMPDIDGDNVAYVDMSGADWDVVVHNLSSGADTRLALPGNQANPKISGEFVAIEDQSSGVSHIILWHWTGGELHYFSPPGSVQTLPAISGNRIVYTDNRNGDLDVYAYDFTYTPSGPPPPSCENPTAPPLADYTATVPGRGRRTGIGGAYFPMNTNMPVLVCMDRVSSVPISAGYVLLNVTVLETPVDINSSFTHLERYANAVRGFDSTAALIVGNPGASIRVRIFPAPGHVGP